MLNGKVLHYIYTHKRDFDQLRKLNSVNCKGTEVANKRFTLLKHRGRMVIKTRIKKVVNDNDKRRNI